MILAQKTQQLEFMISEKINQNSI